MGTYIDKEAELSSDIAKARAFYAEALKDKLIFDTDTGTYNPSEGELVFKFYLNDLGYIYCPADPEKLATLVLMARRHADSDGYGIHRAFILSMYANLKELATPYPMKSFFVVDWDYDIHVIGEKIIFGEWLINNLPDGDIRESIKRLFE